MGALGWRQSLALLETAYDAGIRHFDTAPMYGFGEAERCLGEFLSRHGGEATITTKFGIPAPASKPLVRVARAAMRPVVQAFPGLKKRLQRGVPAASPSREAAVPRAANPIFTGEKARASLDSSLRALRTERIDLWLLHDVDAIDLADDSLLRFLEEAVTAGKIGTFGVGTDRERIPGLLERHPGYCIVTQYEWSVLNPEVGATPFFRIHHRALSEHFSALVEWLRGRPEKCSGWSEEVGADLADSRTLARLMLKASHVLNPASILLFSSKNAEHIHGNVATVEDAALEEPARRLYALFQREIPMTSYGGIP
jgi:diketogulonate reductase-like aldo/keto reductase